jgi:hypothetical protein
VNVHDFRRRTFFPKQNIGGICGTYAEVKTTQVRSQKILRTVMKYLMNSSLFVDDFFPMNIIKIIAQERCRAGKIVSGG